MTCNFIITFIIHLIIRYLNPFSEKVNDKLLTVSLYFSIISLVSVLLIYILRNYLRIKIENNSMEINEFSLGLFVWQSIIFLLLILLIYFVYKIYKKLK